MPVTITVLMMAIWKLVWTPTLSRVDGKFITQDNQWEECVTNVWSGIYKTTHTFVSIVHSNAVGRDMSVISEKLFCHFYTLKKKTQIKKAFLSFLVHIQILNKTPFCTCSFVKKMRFVWSLPFTLVTPVNFPDNLFHPVNQESAVLQMVFWFLGKMPMYMKILYTVIAKVVSIAFYSLCRNHRLKKSLILVENMYCKGLIGQTWKPRWNICMESEIALDVHCDLHLNPLL